MAQLRGTPTRPPTGASSSRPLAPPARTTGADSPRPLAPPERPAGAERPVSEFQDPRQEWRRLVAEVFGTFFLVLCSAGPTMMNHRFPGSVSHTAAVVTPGLMLMALIMFMGKVSGAHFNPAVSLAFAGRGDFPWRRVPAYLVMQVAGAVLAAWFLQGVLHVSAVHGGTYPNPNGTPVEAFVIEAVITLGLVSVILGTASGAQNVGILGAVAIGGYLALAGLWAAPMSGASMNPARSFGPALVGADFSSYWVYAAGPLLGALLAVVMGYLLRGRGGGRTGSEMAQGSIAPEVGHPEQQ